MRAPGPQEHGQLPWLWSRGAFAYGRDGFFANSEHPAGEKTSTKASWLDPSHNAMVPSLSCWTSCGG